MLFQAAFVFACCCLPLQHHTQGLKNFNAAINKFGPDLATWPSDKNPAVAAARVEVIIFIVHVADVCNVMKPRGQATVSAGRFMQGKNHSYWQWAVHAGTLLTLDLPDQ